MVVQVMSTIGNQMQINSDGDRGWRGRPHYRQGQSGTGDEQAWKRQVSVHLNHRFEEEDPGEATDGDHFDSSDEHLSRIRIRRDHRRAT